MTLLLLPLQCFTVILNLNITLLMIVALLQLTILHILQITNFIVENQIIIKIVFVQQIKIITLKIFSAYCFVLLLY